MHEVSIVQGLLDVAVKTARDSGASRIHRLRLRVGAMSGVVPDSLQFAFEALRGETIAAEAELVIDWLPARLWCSQCEREFEGEDFVFECPRCRQCSRDLRQGRELHLADMEVS